MPCKLMGNGSKLSLPTKAMTSHGGVKILIKDSGLKMLTKDSGLKMLPKGG